MKFSLSWLKDHLETDRSLQEITDCMTNIGLEVEEIIDPAASLAPFSTAKILDAKPHPDADRLQICEVETIEGIKSIICGAPNARVGLNVIYAPLGSYLPGADFSLDKKPRKIRGIESNGMLCSAAELGLGENSDGIIELNEEVKIGQPAANALCVDDPVIDFEVTPNRPDWNGIDGIARDLAAAGMGRLREHPAVRLKSTEPSSIQIRIEDKQACPVFAGRLIKNVKNGPSPEWLQKKMQAVGLKSISALVDVTNYFSQDRARPLHVYDADNLTGNIHVRLAKKGESLHALDEIHYDLDEEICVICDDSGVIGLGGVMGGMSTRSLDETVNVFVESALFDPRRTMRTGRKTGIISDARYRFERGVDPQTVLDGLDRACAMIAQLCGGEICDRVIAGDVPDPRQTFEFDYDKVEKLTDIEIEEAEGVRILHDLGFDLEPKKKSQFRVKTPSFRPDIDGEADLVEEILRIHGYDQLPARPLPELSQNHGAAALLPVDNLARLGRNFLAAQGFHEVVSWSFCHRGHAVFFTDEALIPLRNPISSELDVMRPHPFASMLSLLKNNLDQGNEILSLFEIGPEYHNTSPNGQGRRVCLLQTTQITRHWQASNSPDSFSMKAILTALMEMLGLSTNGLQLTTEVPDFYHPGLSGGFLRGHKNKLGYFGQLHPKLLAKTGIELPILAAELDLSLLAGMKLGGKKQVKNAALKLSDRTPIKRDFAFLMDETEPVGPLLAIAAKSDPEKITQLQLFDLFKGGKLPHGKKSVAIEVTISPFGENLTEAQIDAISQKLINAVHKKTGAKLRDF